MSNDTGVKPIARMKYKQKEHINFSNSFSKKTAVPEGGVCRKEPHLSFLSRAKIWISIWSWSSDIMRMNCLRFYMPRGL
jgi:hypothetical protein